MNTLAIITTVLNHPNTLMIEPARRLRLVEAWSRLTTNRADKAWAWMTNQESKESEVWYPEFESDMDEIAAHESQELTDEEWVEEQWHNRAEKESTRCARSISFAEYVRSDFDAQTDEPWTGVYETDLPF